MGVVYMRDTIETAPKDGKVILIEDEDDATGTYYVAHWSPEAGGWVSENGEPIKITPSHWCPMPGENNLQQEDHLGDDLSEASTSASRARRHRFVRFSWIAATLVAAALTGVYFRSEVVQEGTEADQANGREPAPVRQAIVTLALEARQRSENKPGPEVLAKELAEIRRASDGLILKLQADAATAAQWLGQERKKLAALVQDADAARQALTASTAQHRQALEEERARSDALAGELAAVRRDLDMNVALLSKADDEPAQLKQAAEATATELQQERERSATLASELAAARTETETKAVQSKAGDEATHQKQMAERVIAELRQSLQQERDKAVAIAQDAAAARQELTESAEQHRRELEEARALPAALASELVAVRSESENQAAQARKAGDEATQQKQATDSLITELRQTLQEEREKTAALALEAGGTRRATASAEQYRRELEQARARAAALASELAGARSDLDTKVGLEGKADDERQRGQAVEQKPAAVDEKPGVSLLPASANSGGAFVKPVQTAKQPAVVPENSKPAIRSVETVSLPKRVEDEPRGRAMSPDNGYSCQHYRTYDPASGSYKGYDGRRHSCP
jgi:BA14K-like protein